MNQKNIAGFVLGIFAALAVVAAPTLGSTAFASLTDGNPNNNQGQCIKALNQIFQGQLHDLTIYQLVKERVCKSL